MVLFKVNWTWETERGMHAAACISWHDDNRYDNILDNINADINETEQIPTTEPTKNKTINNNYKFTTSFE
jgi:hypothetical protein